MTPEYIIVHDTASLYGNVFMIDQWHKERGFAWDHLNSGTKIHAGYHYLILNGLLYARDVYDERYDGAIIPCRPEDEGGAHCRAGGRNRDSLGVAMVGHPEYTQHQLTSLVDITFYLQKKYGILTENVLGHKEVDLKKRDPGIDMNAFRVFLAQAPENGRV